LLPTLSHDNNGSAIRRTLKGLEIAKIVDGQRRKKLSLPTGLIFERTKTLTASLGLKDGLCNHKAKLATFG